MVKSYQVYVKKEFEENFLRKCIYEILIAVNGKFGDCFYLFKFNKHRLGMQATYSKFEGEKHVFETQSKSS